MTWVKLDDRYATHPKMLRAGPAALALDVAGLCYCAGHGTDGFVPREALAAAAPFLARSKALAAAAQLVAVGRWEQVEGGWRIHDYLDYNPSAAEVDERRNGAVKRTRRWRERRRDGDASTDNDARRDGDASTVDGVRRVVDAAPTPRGLQKPKGQASVTPPDRDASRVTPAAASLSLVAGGASSAAAPQIPDPDRCRHRNDPATCGICSQATGQPPPRAALAEVLRHPSPAEPEDAG